MHARSLYVANLTTMRSRRRLALAPAIGPGAAGGSRRAGIETGGRAVVAMAEVRFVEAGKGSTAVLLVTRGLSGCGLPVCFDRNPAAIERLRLCWSPHSSS